MARTMSVPCRRDLACYRNDGHAGDHAYATPDTVPTPAPNWQAGYDAGYREAQEDIAAIEAEAREQGFAQGFGEALDDLHGNVAEARAALLAELEAGVEGLPELTRYGAGIDRAAVLDLIRKASKPVGRWGEDVYESECRCGALEGQVHATDCKA